MVLSRQCHEDSKFLETVTVATVESTVETVTILLKSTTILAKSNTNSAYLLPFTFEFYKIYDIFTVLVTVLKYFMLKQRLS